MSEPRPRAIARSVALACAFVLGAGFLVAQPAVSHASALAEWSDPPAFIGNVGGAQQVSVSADGNRAIAVWYVDDTDPNRGVNNIQAAAASINGTTATWGPVTTISDGLTTTTTPDIAISADGTRATAVWEQQTGTGTSKAMARSASIAGNVATFQDEIDTIDGEVGNAAPQMQISLSADGRTAAIAYLMDTQPLGATIGTIGDTASSWEPVQAIAPGTSHSNPTIALSADGSKVTAAWTVYGIAGNGARSRSGTVSGGIADWGAEQTLTSDPAGSLQLAMSKAGTSTTALWTATSATGIMAASGTTANNVTTWMAANTLATGPANSLSAPALGLSADGTKALAMWTLMTRVGQFTRTFQTVASSAAIGTDAAVWSTPGGASATDVNAQNPFVGLSDDGTQATAVWSQNGIVARSADVTASGATWGDVTVLSADGEAPGIGVSADGSRATAVFAVSQTGTYGVSMGLTQTLTFDPNGGTGTMDAITANATAALPPNAFVRTGFTFTGWNTEADGTGVPYANEAEYAFGQTRPLYAQWLANDVPPGPDPDPAKQHPLGNCVKDSKTPAIPQAGTRTVTGANCVTNAGSIVGTSITVKATRGDVRTAVLGCKTGSRIRLAIPTGYSDGSRYCRNGKLVVRTFGQPLKIKVAWRAPAVSGFTAYIAQRTFRT